VQGLIAGAVGTAVFTAFQKLTQPEPNTEPSRWDDAPEPAQVGKRVAEGLFEHPVTLKDVPLLTQIFHWSYGTIWGAIYALIEESVRRPLVSAAALTTTVMATDYSLLPAMKIYEPPWEYSPGTLAKDYATHLVHGLAIAGTYRSLDQLFTE
jgi:uncharacterized membrane protein YagU involved in acid resistance